MYKIIKIIHFILPFNNIYQNILFYLCLSPLMNYILINLYYYNCGGYINSFKDIINILNPFTMSNPLCILLNTLICGNLYFVQYIYISVFLFLLSLFF